MVYTDDFPEPTGVRTPIGSKLSRINGVSLDEFADKQRKEKFI